MAYRDLLELIHFSQNPSVEFAPDRIQTFEPDRYHSEEEIRLNEDVKIDSLIQDQLEKKEPVVADDNNNAKKSLNIALDQDEVIEVVNNGDGTFSIRVENVVGFGSSASSLSTNLGAKLVKTITAENFKKVPHEMVMLCLTGKFFSSDVKMNTVFPTMSDNLDKQTPDAIIEEERNYNVFELKTFRGDDLTDSYSKALLKYRVALENRSTKKPIDYYVMVVGQRQLLTTLNLNAFVGIKKEIFLHYHLGLLLLNSARQLGLKDKQDEEAKETIDKFKEAIAKASDSNKIPDIAPPPIISHAMLRNWDNMPTLEEREQFFVKIFETARKEIRQGLMEENPVTRTKATALRNDFHKEWLANECRSDKKAPIQLPFFRVKRISFKDDWQMMTFSDQLPNNVMGRVWKSAVLASAHKYELFLKQDKEKTIAKALMSGDEYSRREDRRERRKYHRCILDLAAEDREYLSLHAFQAKKFKDRVASAMFKKNQKKPFSPFCDVSDIDGFFLKMMSLLKKNPVAGSCNFVRNKTMALRLASKAIFKDDLHMAEIFVEEFENTVIGQSLSLFNLIIEEINVSMQQFCKKDEVIIKQLPIDGIYLMIKPTKPDKNAVFTLLLDRECFESFELPFKASGEFSNEKYIVYDFMSINRHKISHYLYTLETTCLLFAMWCDLEKKMPSEVLSSPENHPQIINHFTISFLALMEDKPQTSSMLQVIRYGYMEACKLAIVNPNPLKILKRFDTRPKSRLLVWIYRRVVEAFTIMMEHQPIVRNLDLSLEDDRLMSTLSDVQINEEITEMENELAAISKSNDQDNNNNSSPLLLSNPDQIEVERRAQYLRFRIEKLKQHKKASEVDEDILEDELDYADLMSESKNVISGDNFVNLISWVDLKPISSFSIALNLSYIGSLHNKDERDQLQGYFKIFNKVISEELELRKSATHLMGFDTRKDLKYRDHEFDYKFATYCGLEVRKYLENKFSRSFHNFLEDKLHLEVLKHDSEHFATFKASSVPVPPKYDDKDKSSHRRKALEAVIEKIRTKDNGESLFDIHPFANIDKIIDLIEAQGGVRANLFDKQQIGGNREIFVLDILSRVGINFVETIARIICDELPMEMLTKGDMKVQKSDSHYNRVAAQKKKGDKTETIIDSDDATTWAQRFIMPVFAAVLKPILPDNLFRIVVRVLNCVTNKKLELPKELLAQFLKFPEAVNFEKGQIKIDEGINELKRQFLGTSEYHDLIDKPGDRLLNNKSNMMQGILHYVSSLVHSAYLMVMARYNSTFIGSAIAKSRLKKEVKLVQTSKCSSDDSAVIRTLIHQEEDSKVISYYLTWMSRAKKIGYVLLTIKQSEEKSTSESFSSIEEFNSIWSVANTIMTPLIKFVYSASKLKVMSRIDSRINILSELRKQLIENGGSIHLAAICQDLHFGTHFSSLGAQVNPLFDEYSEELLTKPHPSLGYFVWEPEAFCGILGYDFAHYIAITRDPKLSSVENWLITKEGAEISELGKPTITTTLAIGDSKKYLDFIKSINIPKNWREIEEKTNHELLFRRARTDEETLFNIYKKALTPSSAEAFSFQTSSKLHASAVYILNTPSVSVTERKLREKGELTKFSLYGLIKTKVELGLPMDRSMINFIFPDHDLYETVLTDVGDISSSFISRRLSYVRANRYAVLTMPKIPFSASVSLLNVVKRRWFSLDTAGSATEHRQAFEVYQQMFPWLADNFDLSLAASPFKDGIALADFIKAQIPSFKHSKVLGPIRKGLPFALAVRNIIRNCQLPGHVMVRIQNVSTPDTEVFAGIGTKISLITSGPYETDVERIEKVKRLLTNVIPPILKGNELSAQTQLMQMKENDAVISVLQSIYRKQYPLSRLLLAARRGKLAIFPQQQKYNPSKRKYEGPGVAQGIIDGVAFVLQLKDDEIKRIIVSDLQRLKVNRIDFVKMLKEMSMKPSSSADMGESYFDVEKGVISKIKTRTSVPIDERIDLHSPDLSMILEEYNERPQFSTTIGLKGNIKLSLKTRRGLITILNYDPPIWRTEASLALAKEDVYTISKGDSIPDNNNDRQGVINSVASYWYQFRSVPDNALISKISNLRSIWERNQIECDLVERNYNDSEAMSDFKRDLKDFNKALKIVNLKKWMKDTLEEKARFLNMRPNYLVQAPKSEEDVDFSVLGDIEDEDFTRDMLNGIQIEVEEIEWGTKMFDSLSRNEIERISSKFEDSSILESRTEKPPTRISNKVQNIWSIHPFWNQIIMTLQVTLRQVNELLLGNYRIDIPKTQLGSLIYWLLDVERREILVSEDVQVNEEDIDDL